MTITINYKTDSNQKGSATVNSIEEAHELLYYLNNIPTNQQTFNYSSDYELMRDGIGTSKLCSNEEACRYIEDWVYGSNEDKNLYEKCTDGLTKNVLI